MSDGCGDYSDDCSGRFTFCLPDGREKKRVVELHGLKASNPLAEIVAAPFVLAGFGLIWLGDDDEDDDDPSGVFESKEREREAEHRAVSTLAGVGSLAVGAGLHALLGGEGDSLSGYPVFVDFNEPEDTREPQIAPFVPRAVAKSRERVAASRPVGLGDGPTHRQSAIAKLRRLRLTLPPDHTLRLCVCPAFVPGRD